MQKLLEKWMARTKTLSKKSSAVSHLLIMHEHVDCGILMIIDIELRRIRDIKECLIPTKVCERQRHSS